MEVVIAYLILITILAFAVPLIGNDMILAQEKEQTSPQENTGQQSPSSDEQESIKGYPVRKRSIGTPLDVEWDLDNSFPKRGSVLELILQCRENQQQ